jgi:hypothetical protein
LTGAATRPYSALRVDLDMAASNPMALEQLVRARLMPGEVVLILASVAAALLIALRRERLPSAAPSTGEEPVLPAPLRELELYRLRYGARFTEGRLRADERSRTRLWIVTGAAGSPAAAGPGRIPWRTPAPDFPTSPDRLLGVIEAGGRTVASVDAESGRVALHDADLGRLHGLGRRGRAVFLWPVGLATLAFWLLARVRLSEYLASALGMSAGNVRLSLLVAAATFAGELSLILAPVLIALSALLRRVRRNRLRQQYEPALRAFLASVYQRR